MEDKAKLLREAIIRAKSGRIQGFEEIYFLTYEKTFQDIYAIIKDEEYSWNILKKIYLTIYEKIPDMPAVGSLDIWIQSIIAKEVGSKLGTDEIDKKTSNSEKAASDQINKNFGDLSGKATSCLIEIEEKIDTITEDENKSSAKELGFNITKIIGAILVAVAAIAAVIFTYHMLSDGINNENNRYSFESEIYHAESSQASVESPSDAERKSGWVKTDKGQKYLESDMTYAKQTWKKIDGQLYYIDRNELMVTGSMELEGQTYKFTKSGMLYGITRDYEPETADTQLTRKLKEMDREEDKESVISNSLTVFDGWMYYLFKEDAEAYPKLLRASVTENRIELLEEDVSAYFIYEKTIYFFRDNIMTERSTDEPGEEIKKASTTANMLTAIASGYYLGVEGGSFYLLDASGNKAENIQNTQIDGRSYRIEDGRIKYVKAIPQSTRGITYYLNDSLDNKIYWKSSDGQNGILISDGTAIMSFCLAGEWIYYNTCTGINGSGYKSKICRISIDGVTREDVSQEFSGVMQNMYYYTNVGKIFMEYQPHIPQKTYCSIAVISLDGSMHQIDDSFIRNTQAVSGDDQMELIMADNSNLYCYWHECSKDASGQVSVVWTQPVVIPY